MTAKVFGLAAILFLAGGIGAGQAAITHSHASRSVISKKTAAAIGLIRLHDGTGRQLRPAPKKGAPESVKAQSRHEEERGKRPSPASLSTAAGNTAGATSPAASPPIVPSQTLAAAPSQAPNSAALARPISPPPLAIPARQPGSLTSTSSIGGANAHRPPSGTASIGGAAVAGAIGRLEGSSFHPRRR